MVADPTFLAGKRLPAGSLRDLCTSATYTPTLTATTTNPNLGSGGSFAQDGEHHYTGRLVTVFFNLTFGTTGPTAGSGTYLIGLPTGFDVDASWMAVQMAVGQVRLQDSSGGDIRYWHVRASSSDANKLVLQDQAGASVTNAVPWVWAASDSIRGSATYLTD